MSLLLEGYIGGQARGTDLNLVQQLWTAISSEALSDNISDQLH